MILTILGNNSALPSHGRYPTAQVLTVHQEQMLIDCGEGTQIRFQRNNVKTAKIEKIFISHLHGDHYFGLIGLLTSMSLNNRTRPIRLYGPSLLIDIIHLQLAAASTELSFPLYFYPLSGDTVIIDDNYSKVSVFKTDHRIECYGFRFEEKHHKRKVLMDKIQELDIPHTFIGEIVRGKDWIDDRGIVYPNEMLTNPPSPSKVYVYTADTRYCEDIIPNIVDCDLLYHETTYLAEHQSLAHQRYHSTTIDAANMAISARVQKLVIGHFSSKYRELQPFLDECQAIFPNTSIAEEGIIFEI